MSYVESSLVPGEIVRFHGRVHWWIVVGPLLAALFGVLLIAYESRVPTYEASPWPALIGALLVLAGAIKLISGIIYQQTTELAVTDRKVIGKWGFIRRNTIEQRLDKMDATLVHQGLIGRMLDFGDIVIRGSGTTNTPISTVSNPLQFRRAVDMAASDFEMRPAKP